MNRTLLPTLYLFIGYESLYQQCTNQYKTKRVNVTVSSKFKVVLQIQQRCRIPKLNVTSKRGILQQKKKKKEEKEKERKKQNENDLLTTFIVNSIIFHLLVKFSIIIYVL